MGFCYERVYDGTKIKNVTEIVKEKTMKYYNRHHAALNRAVSGFEGKIMFFDLHSFEEELLMPGVKTRELPDICLGCNSGFHEKIMQTAVSAFEYFGYKVSVNYPFSGSLVPNIVLNGANADICSLMIEVNKPLYLDGRGGVIGETVENVRRVIRCICSIV
ncbi:MAG: N-formylglutamate amidohydrolase [Clostridia bacterium]|nr:N-formylglutamate amidohydrolase [Clostridia bacterium]